MLKRSRQTGEPDGTGGAYSSKRGQDGHEASFSDMTAMSEQRVAVTAPRWRRAAVFQQLGPGLVTGAADDDPSGIATYSQAGAQFGYNMLWTMPLTYPLMSAVQLVSAQIGRVTGKGLAKNIGEVFPKPVVLALIALLFLANTINIGANLAAMGAAAKLVVGWGSHVFTIIFALLSLTLQLFMPYERYARYLKWLTLVLLAYVAVVFAVKVDWHAVGMGLIAPRFPLTSDSFTMVVAVLGTTISPYLLFWQSSQEVEKIDQKPRCIRSSKILEKPRPSSKNSLGYARRHGRLEYRGDGHHGQHRLDLARSRQSHWHRRRCCSRTQAHRRRVCLRSFQPGDHRNGSLSIPVLAGSAAYAFGEAQGWKCGLDNKPGRRSAFIV